MLTSRMWREFNEIEEAKERKMRRINWRLEAELIAMIEYARINGDGSCNPQR